MKEIIAKKDLETVVTDIVGEDAVKITNYLYDKENISEFVIAEEIGYEIHKARYLLYKLLEHNLASFVRKKDRIRGWYICYWTLNLEQVKKQQAKIIDSKIGKLQSRLDREESNQFYMCSSACIRLDFDEAVDNEYKCPECGELLNVQNNERTIQYIKQQIRELEANKVTQEDPITA